ncbi:hypothetical protein [Dictyobacter arantiisoli]|uniref:hypothetical protein n=1 Tax=Dictyobacter arantiisoli TaxID=2014874 RepID=UPI0011EF3B5A|nr:hypothetical protein [Dictyobacter arantiisoli]
MSTLIHRSVCVSRREERGKQKKLDGEEARGAVGVFCGLCACSGQWIAALGKDIRGELREGARSGSAALVKEEV